MDADTEALVKQIMEERGISFKEAVNAAIRAGLTPPRDRVRFSTPSFRMGAHPKIDLDKALRLAGELEDDERARRIAARK